MSIRIRGQSDDLVEVEGPGNAGEEYCAYSKIVYIDIEDLGGGVTVLVWFDDQTPMPNIGCAGWRVGIEMMREGAEFPWPISVEMEPNGYSPVVVVGCPENVKITVRRYNWLRRPLHNGHQIEQNNA